MAMRGHAAANILPVVASNRIGVEASPDGRALTFYGSSFIAGPDGGVLAQMDRVGEGVVTASVDLEAVALMRATWGLFRDRRPDTYGAVATLDGMAR
jgi:N-carbamoylputrescine amidase